MVMRQVIGKALFVSALLLAVGNVHGSWLTKSENFSTATNYGLNFAKYAVEEQSGKDAAKKILESDLAFDLFKKDFELIGGNPKALQSLKDDIGKVTEVLDGVEKIATALGAGDNVDALIASIDVVLGTTQLSNYPLVGMLWSSIKVARESQLAVAASQAALEIETLYGIVNQDRRLVGVMDGDNPPLIPLDSDSITYFFNKYLITDASVRALVKTYVEKEIGDAFPTPSDGTRFWSMLTGTSDAIAEEHELRELDEFRNRSRAWIRTLLNDLNKQVQKQWAEARVRRLHAEFRSFHENFGSMYGSLDEAMKYFELTVQIKGEINDYPARLAQLEKRGNELLAEYRELKVADAQRKLAIRSELIQMADAAQRYGVRAMTVEEYKLRDGFMNFRELVLRYAGSIGDDVDSNIETAVAEIYQTEPIKTETVGVEGQTGGFYGALQINSARFRAYEQQLLDRWKPYLQQCEGFVASLDPAPLDRIAALLDAFNYPEAKQVYDAWWSTTSQKADEHTVLSNDVEIVVNKSMPPLLDSIYVVPFLEYHDRRIARASASSRQKLIEEKAHYIYQIENRVRSARAYLDASRQESELRTRIRNKVKSACQLQIQASGFQKDKQAAEALLAFYTSKRDEVKAVGGELLSQLREIRSHLQYAQAYESDTLGHAENYLRDNTHVALKVIDANSTITDIRIASTADIQGALSFLPVLIDTVGEPVALVDAVERARERLKSVSERITPELIMLYRGFGDLENPDSLSRPWRSFPEDLGNLYEQVKKLEQQTSTSGLLNRANAFTRKARTEVGNLAAEWRYLQEMRRQWDEWYQQQTSAGNIRGEHFVFEFEQDYRTDFGDTWGTIPQRYLATDFAIMRLNNFVSKFATEADLQNSTRAQEARRSLMLLPVAGFFQKHMPNTWQLIDDQLALRHFSPAKEDNLAFIWESELDKADRLLAQADPASEQFEELMSQIAPLLPMTMTPEGKLLPSKERYEYAFAIKDFPLGARYLELRETLLGLWSERSRLMAEQRIAKQREESSALFREAFMTELAELRQRQQALARTSRLARSDVILLETDYSDLNRRYFGDASIHHQDLTDAIYKLGEDIRGLHQKFHITSQQIQSLYQNFINAYGRGDLRGLLRLLADDWEGGDGSDVRDVENYLSNSFRMFERIQYRISGFSAQPSGEVARVSYSVRIIGENRRQRLTHEENVQVVEEVGLVNGEPRILRTISGTQWLR